MPFLIAGQVIHGYVAGPHLGRIGLDANRRLRAVHEPLGSRPAGYADPLADLGVGVIVELPSCERIAGERDVQDWLVVGIGLGECRRRRKVHREAARGLRDGRLHVGGGSVDALFQNELEREARVSLSALGGHQFQTVDLHELLAQAASRCCWPSCRGWLPG